MSVSVAFTRRLPGLTLDIEFEAGPGVTALFGPSGAGKTCAINAVAGLLRPDQGRISVGDELLFDSVRGIDLPVHRRRAGYVFQDARLFPHLNVRANLEYGRRRGRGGSVDMDEIIAILGLAPLLSRRPAALSGGEKSRVALGRAILSAPRILLMDEPLAALDPARKAEILPYLERLRDHLGLPILYVTHDMTELLRLASHVVMIEAGRSVAAGPAAQVLSDPAVAARLGPREAGAILTGHARGCDDYGLNRIETAGGTLWLGGGPIAPETRLRLRILAQDVMLATRRPEQISALNLLEGRVLDITQAGPDGVLVRVGLGSGADMVLSRITRRSLETLALAPGKAVFAVLKTVSLAPPGLIVES